jgi:hypothetical protein
LQNIYQNSFRASVILCFEHLHGLHFGHPEKRFLSYIHFQTFGPIIGCRKEQEWKEMHSFSHVMIDQLIIIYCFDIWLLYETIEQLVCLISLYLLKNNHANSPIKDGYNRTRNRAIFWWSELPSSKSSIARGRDGNGTGASSISVLLNIIPTR